MHIPITVFETNIFDVANNSDKSPCYLCARMRRGHLYKKAQELGCVTGPKQLGVFGASYLYPVFLRLGIICASAG